MDGRRHAEELQEEVGSAGVVSHQEAAVSVMTEKDEVKIHHTNSVTLMK